jgi:hypothetical protein
MNIRNAKILGSLSSVMMLAACSPYPATEADFGNSVRHMVRSQSVTSGPVDTTPVETGDGERLNGVIEAYRTDVARGEPLQQPVAVSFGSGAPQ